MSPCWHEWLDEQINRMKDSVLPEEIMTISRCSCALDRGITSFSSSEWAQVSKDTSKMAWTWLSQESACCVSVNTCICANVHIHMYVICLSQITIAQLVRVVHAFNPSTQDTEEGGSLWGFGQPGLQIKFQDHQDYIQKPCLENKKRKKEMERLLLMC